MIQDVELELKISLIYKAFLMSDKFRNLRFEDIR